MWGGSVPDPQSVAQLTAVLTQEWTRAVDQMLRHWSVPPVFSSSYWNCVCFNLRLFPFFFIFFLFFIFVRGGSTALPHPIPLLLFLWAFCFFVFLFFVFCISLHHGVHRAGVYFILFYFILFYFILFYFIFTRCSDRTEGKCSGFFPILAVCLLRRKFTFFFFFLFIYSFLLSILC